MERACGCHVGAQTELVEPWFGNGALLARCPDTLALSSTGASYDVIDVDACNAAGVLLVNQSRTNNEGVAEHAIGLILALSKKIGLTNRSVAAGRRQ